MTTLPELLLTRLQADPVITGGPPTGLQFVVQNRWPVRKGNPGATPDAFDDERGGRMKRVIVVLDGTENDAPGRQPEGTKRLLTSPTTHLFAEPHEGGKQAVNDAYRRIERLLIGWDAQISSDERVGLVSGSRLFIEDSEQFPGNVVLVARWPMTGTRRLVPA